MKIDGNEIKVGNIIKFKSKLWKIIKTQHTQPGKGGAYLQVEMKDIKEGTKMNERFRSSETVERVILDEKECQYLYNSENGYCFMDNLNFDQIEIGKDIISESQSIFLKENDNVIIQSYENNPVSIILPEHISFKVIESEPVIKGQTASSSYKPAILERNIKVSVPPFIQVGDEIVINSNNLSYVEKKKK